MLHRQDRMNDHGQEREQNEKKELIFVCHHNTSVPKSGVGSVKDLISEKATDMPTSAQEIDLLGVLVYFKCQ